MQQVDGLTPSVYLIETAKENIAGKITIDEVKYRIDNYYKQQNSKLLLGESNELKNRYLRIEAIGEIVEVQKLALNINLGGQKKWSDCSSL